jgi:hypothetical protein
MCECAYKCNGTGRKGETLPPRYCVECGLPELRNDLCVLHYHTEPDGVVVFPKPSCSCSYCFVAFPIERINNE